MRFGLLVNCLVLSMTLESVSYAQAAEVESKKFSAGIEVSALGLFAGNFSLGYIVDPSLAIEAYRETPTYSFFSFPPDRGYMAGIKLRHFLGNSFNVAWSPYYRRIDYAGEAPANHVGISASIGNRWRHERAYFGFDWLGGGADRRVVSGEITKKESGFGILLRLAFGTYI
jgi:hypothetical protein